MRIFREGAVFALREQIAQGRPIIVANAGTGLSAKCAEAGDDDPIVVYSSGRYRMAGRGSVSGLFSLGGGIHVGN